MRQIVVREEGYAYVFVSNENPTQVDIHFDELKVTHTKTRVIQYNEYYPFGLQTERSWTRDNNKNAYLYNAATELNNTSGWYETHFRGYDAALGRFLQVDPMATKYSALTPYNYAFNSPTILNDPSGADPRDQWGNDLKTAWDYYDRYGYDAYINYMAYGNMYGVSTSAEAMRYNTRAFGQPGADYMIGPSDEQYELYAVVESNYGKWVNLGYDWLDLSTKEQIENREKLRRRLSEQQRQEEGPLAFNPSSDSWNALSNYMTGIGMSIDGAAFSLGKKLDNRLAYSPRNTSFGQWMPKPLPPGPIRIAGLTLSTGFVKGMANTLKVGGVVLGFVGGGMTIMEIASGEKNLVGEGGLDLIMGGVAFIPGGGWIASGIYFGGKWALETTGNDFWNK